MWIPSGSQQVWDSATCPMGQTEKTLLLSAGKDADVNVTWNGNVVTSDYAAANMTPAFPAGASASSTPGATASSSMSPSMGQVQTASGSITDARIYRFRFVMRDKDFIEDRVFIVG